jgi:hypothetical protein
MLNCGGRHLTYVAGNRTVLNGARFRGSSLLGRFDALIRIRLTVFRGEQDKSGVQSPDLSRGKTGALAGEARPCKGKQGGLAHLNSPVQSAQPQQLRTQSRSNDRCTPASGRSFDRGERQLRATTGLMHRSKKAPYSITWSARVSSVGGTSRPSALAVIRLMTRSNLVGCSTGRSAGFAPQILSTKSPARR